MFVIAVSNQKGGVGKTTTSIALAASLAAGRQRVLLCDLDPQGNLAVGLGLAPDAGPDLHAVLTTRAAVGDAARPLADRRLASLEVVTAGPRLAQAEGELIGQVGFDEVLRRKLDQAGGRYDFAVLDCPPSLGPLTINALGAADLVVVPVQCEFFSARGVVKLMELVELVRERRNPGLRVRLVPTLFDGRNAICRAVLGELRREFGADVSEVTVGVDTRVRESQAHGVPISLYAARTRATIAYQALAAEVRGIAQGGAARVQAA